jgi:hypothetical protein
MPILLATEKGNFWVKGEALPGDEALTPMLRVDDMEDHPCKFRGDSIIRMTLVSQAEYEGSEKAKREREDKAMMTRWITEIAQAGVISEGVKGRILATINPDNPNPGNGPKLIVPGGR